MADLPYQMTSLKQNSQETINECLSGFSWARSLPYLGALSGPVSVCSKRGLGLPTCRWERDLMIAFATDQHCHCSCGCGYDLHSIAQQSVWSSGVLWCEVLPMVHRCFDVVSSCLSCWSWPS